MALEAKYLLDGESRMQELHDQLRNMILPRLLRELRAAFFVELGALGNVVAYARKTRASPMRSTNR